MDNNEKIIPDTTNLYCNADRLLKPCPFCGSLQILVSPKPVEEAKEQTAYHLNCMECNSRHTVVTRFKSQVLATWNYRYNDEF